MKEVKELMSLFQFLYFFYKTKDEEVIKQRLQRAKVILEVIGNKTSSSIDIIFKIKPLWDQEMSGQFINSLWGKNKNTKYGNKGREELKSVRDSAGIWKVI